MTLRDTTVRMTEQVLFNRCAVCESLCSDDQFLLVTLEHFYDYFPVNYAQ